LLWLLRLRLRLRLRLDFVLLYLSKLLICLALRLARSAPHFMLMNRFLNSAAKRKIGLKSLALFWLRFLSLGVRFF